MSAVQTDWMARRTGPELQLRRRGWKLSAAPERPAEIIDLLPRVPFPWFGERCSATWVPSRGGLHAGRLENRNEAYKEVDSAITYAVSGYKSLGCQEPL